MDNCRRFDANNNDTTVQAGGRGQVEGQRVALWLTVHQRANDRSMEAAKLQLARQLRHAETTDRASGAKRRECRTGRTEQDGGEINPSSKRYQCIFQQNDRAARVRAAAAAGTGHGDAEAASAGIQQRQETTSRSSITSFRQFIWNADRCPIACRGMCRMQY